MDMISQFFAMGGYAVYVWPALAIAAIVMIGLFAQTLRSLRARERELAALGESPARGAKTR